MIVVDASVAIKWFVDEPLHTCARHILEYQLEMQAPDCILIEVANAARKKATRREIGNDHARQIVSLVAEAISTLIPASKILNQAMELALALDHPIYDCLYLACMTDQHDGLVTADKKFFDKVKQTEHGGNIRFLDDPELALPLFLSIRKTDEIVDLYDRLEQAYGNVRSITSSEKPEDYELVFDSPTGQRLYALLQSLNAEELTDVLALGLLGRGQEGLDWTTFRNQVKATVQNGDFRIIAAKANRFKRGLSVLRSQQ